QALHQFELEHEEFELFIKQHGKNYQDEVEYESRFRIFRDNLAYIRVFNSMGDTMVLGVNEFADMDFIEFRSKYLTHRFPARESVNVETFEGLTAPTSVDWRTKGAVTGVKNQGQCGSCWAFGASEALSDRICIAGGPNVVLSPQWLVDCNTANYGCNGGYPIKAWQFMMGTGIVADSCVPYPAADGKCPSTC
ncbi:C1 family peptidase, partial [Klebsiella pneumoniae]